MLFCMILTDDKKVLFCMHKFILKCVCDVPDFVQQVLFTQECSVPVFPARFIIETLYTAVKEGVKCKVNDRQRKGERG